MTVEDGSRSVEPKGRMLIYQDPESPVSIEVRLEGETVWLTQQQRAELFQSSRSNVVEHIGNIYAEGELDEEATCREFRQVCFEGSRKVARTLPHYNLDMIISLGLSKGTQHQNRSLQGKALHLCAKTVRPLRIK